MSKGSPLQCEETFPPDVCADLMNLIGAKDSHFHTLLGRQRGPDIYSNKKNKKHIPIQYIS